MKELSVIIPVFNVEKYVAKCLDSVLKQAPYDSEIILIDDGSTDSSGRICDEYREKDERIQVIHQKNKGLSGARNTGIGKASGRKLFFIDSDDYLEDGYFSVLMQYDADIVIGNYEAFYDDGHENIWGEFETIQYSSLKTFLTDFHKYFPVTFNTAWGKVYRTEIIKEKCLRFTEGVSMVEDVLFNTEYYKHCATIQMVNEAAVMYRQTQMTLSKKYPPELVNWYEESYTKVEALLRSAGVFEGENEKWFYKKYFGNLYESIRGICTLKKAERNIKLAELVNNPRVQAAAGTARPSGFLTIGLKKAIKEKSPEMILMYLKVVDFLSSIKRKVKRI